MDVGERIEVGGDELDVRRDAHGAEQPATDGAEESFGEFGVGEGADQRGELTADLAPQGTVLGLLTE